MISPRSLFGTGVGVIGLDFGTRPSMLIGNIEIDITFPDPLPDRHLLAQPKPDSERPLMEWCGVKHVEMTRSELLDFIEMLDWHIGRITGRDT
jgi:hypothetical protein